MNVTRYPVEKVVALLNEQQVATMPQLKAALGTAVAATVFRKLAGLPYHSSYSHRGAFYTLDSVARFDRQGLWSHGEIHFSRHGTLLDTAAALVTAAPAGFLADELSAVVRVAAKDALRQLVEARRLSRQEWQGRFLYCAPDRARRHEQWAARQAGRPGDDVAAAKALFFSLLDERQRRLFAGLESLQQGPGGERRAAEFFGLNVDTVARGRAELLGQKVARGRARQPGAGRPAAEKKRPKS